MRQTTSFSVAMKWVVVVLALVPIGAVAIAYPGVVLLITGVALLLRRVLSGRTSDPTVPVDRQGLFPVPGPIGHGPEASQVRESTLSTFLGESGSGDLPDRSTRVLYVAALLVRQDVLQLIRADLRQIARDAGFTEVRKFGFRGVELFNGKGPWAGLDPQIRADAYLSALDLLAEYQVNVASAAVDKVQLANRLLRQPRNPRNWRARTLNAHVLGVELVYTAISEVIQSEPQDILMDRPKMRTLLQTWRPTSRQDLGGGIVYGDRFRRLIEEFSHDPTPPYRPPLFRAATFDHTPGLMLANLVAYAIQRRNRGPAKDSRTEELLRALENRIDGATIARVTWPVGPSSELSSGEV